MGDLGRLVTVLIPRIKAVSCNTSAKNSEAQL